MKKERGKYIVIEGGEGCGKTTQAQKLVDFLNEKGVKTIRAREPGSTHEAEQIRAVLLNEKNNLTSLTEVFLFEAARTEFFRREVVPNLQTGTSVVADRSGYSTEAYQGYAGGANKDLIFQLNHLATFGVRPDLLFILDIKAEQGLKKEQDSDRFALKGLEYHRKVNQGYREIAKRESDISVVIPYREGDVNAMQNEIRRHVQERLGI